MSIIHPASGLAVRLRAGGPLGGVGSDTANAIGFIELVDGVRTATSNLDPPRLLVGTAGNDYLHGGGGNDTIQGLSGFDTLRGGGGDDLIEGGDWWDILDGDDGNDTLDAGADGGLAFGGQGDDLLIGGSGLDYLHGGAGNDTLVGGDGVDEAVYDFRLATAGVTLDASAVGTAAWADIGDGEGGIDRIGGIERLEVHGSIDHADSLVGSVGADRLHGLGGADTLVGGAGDDLLFGDTGDDSMVGGAGNDTLQGDAGSDTLVGGGGVDLVIYNFYTASSGVMLDGSGAGPASVVDIGDGQGGVDRLDGIEILSVTGSDAHADRIAGGTGNDWLYAHGGDDTVAGGEGDDTVHGGQGHDMLRGDLGNDSVAGEEGSDRLDGGQGNDTLTGGVGNDTLDGGIGNDVMLGDGGNETYHVDSSGDVTRESHASPKEIDTVLSSVNRTLNSYIENLTLAGTALQGNGNNADNLLTGNTRNNTLQGVTGSDTLIGHGGNDTLNGGTGNDSLLGGAGDDVYVVDASADVVVELAGQGIDRVSSTVSWTLGDHVENLTLAGTAAIYGTGNALANTIGGNPGANAIDGDFGDDTLNGFDGNDTLTGGPGADRLSGGHGADNFRFVTAAEGGDTITDFAPGADRIEVVAANFGLVAGATATLVVNGLPTTGGGTFVYTSASGRLQFDRDDNGGGAAVSLATLAHRPATLAPADIVLGS